MDFSGQILHLREIMRFLPAVPKIRTEILQIPCSTVVFNPKFCFIFEADSVLLLFLKIAKFFKISDTVFLDKFETVLQVLPYTV